MRSRRSVLALGCAWLVVAAGCAGPRLRVDTEPASTTVLVDGEPMRKSKKKERDVPLPYYGALVIDAVPPPAAADLVATRRVVRVDEPINPWLFPLDLPLEIVTRPFRAQTTEVHVELERRPPLPPGEYLPSTDEVRARARRAQVER
jgi:hypothetical protein